MNAEPPPATIATSILLGDWGGEEAIIAISRHWRAQISIFLPGHAVIHIPNPPDRTLFRQVYLAYNGMTHYDAVVTRAQEGHPPLAEMLAELRLEGERPTHLYFPNGTPISFICEALGVERQSESPVEIRELGCTRVNVRQREGHQEKGSLLIWEKKQASLSTKVLHSLLIFLQ